MTTINPLHPAALAAHATDRTEEHVVLATDGRAAASAATRWLAERARSHVIDVDLVHVVAGQPAGAGAPSIGDHPTVRAKRFLSVMAPSVEASTRVVPGDAHEVLVDLTRAADLIVLGTRRNAASLHLVASFATRFALSACCPVVVVPQRWRSSAGPVVVGVAGDGSDTAAIEFAVHEASVLHRDLVLVHAWQLALLVWPALEVDAGGHASAVGPAARLAAVADPLRERYPGVRIVRVLEHDAPVRALVRDARDASLLVVGTHGLEAVERFLLGSTSRGVLERPACPVAVVRQFEVSGPPAPTVSSTRVAQA
jgi:nucleotide-binding universal stress UspA family protein